MNSAVFLTTEGSPVLETMKEFERAGSTVLSCATCLNYYGRQEQLRVGAPTNMKDTVEAMLDFAVTLAP